MTPEERRESQRISTRKYLERINGTPQNEQRLARARSRYHERKQERDELGIMRRNSKARYANDRRKSLFEGAKRRAKLQGLPFSIRIDDIVIPEICPVLGIPICVGLPPNSPNLPSLDKFIPELGYVPGNIFVISLRANSLKRDATLKELLSVCEWMSNVMKISSDS